MVCNISSIKYKLDIPYSDFQGTKYVEKQSCLKLVSLGKIENIKKK